MDNISKVKISFERLLKVWLSKLDFDEEELVAEDLAWFIKIFDSFFKGENLNVFINREGRYKEVSKFSESDFSQILDLSYKYTDNKNERLALLKVELPSVFEYYNQLNELYVNKDNKYNLIDIYFRILKKLYFHADRNDLSRLKNLVILSVNSIAQKISIFEGEGFNSSSLLKDFYYDVIWNLFTKREIKEDFPDEEFLSMVLFKSSFSVYYLPFFKHAKIPLVKRYLLNVWIYLNELKKDNLLDQFLNSLADMTISNLSYRELDLYDIRSLLKIDDLDSEYYNSLNKIKSAGSQIVLKEDIDDYLLLSQEVSLVETPSYIPRNYSEYFLKTEEDSAITLYKFRAIQGFVLEYLSIVLDLKKDVNYFNKCLNRLRKNEQWSNHRKFFPQSIHDVLIWLILFSNVKREMDFRVLEPSPGYRYLGDVLVFLFIGIAFDESAIKHSLELRNLQFNSSFLHSMADLSKDLSNKAKDNFLLSGEEKEKVILFLRSLTIVFGGQIEKSESLAPIEPIMFENLISDIKEQYKDRSIVYFLSQYLSPFSRGLKYIEELRTFVVASELQYRKYLIPNWYSASYGLSGSFSRYLVENEILQFDYRFLEKKVPLKAEELKRESVQRLVEKYGEDALFVFRNAYPGFWLGNERSNSKVNEADKPISFSYNTYDRNSELIIIPKSSMSILYLYDGRLRSLQFVEGILMCELVDLGGGNQYSAEVAETIEKFRNSSDKYNEDLGKFFWIRIVAKTKIVIKDKSSILRFKLNPYGE